MNFYITGDKHGDFSDIDRFCEKKHMTKENDVMIILGDVGLNYFGDRRDYKAKLHVSSLPITTFCIHGNHEARPTDVVGYKRKYFHKGMVWYQEEFPNILFAKDGEIYSFGDQRCIVIGGAYSVDRYYRFMMGYPWFENEQPDNKIKARVLEKLAKNDNKIDIVLSHTCPLKYEPTEVFLPFIKQDEVDKSTEKFLDAIEKKIDYKKWYCGHYHTEKKIDKMRFMYHRVKRFNED